MHTWHTPLAVETMVRTSSEESPGFMHVALAHRSAMKASNPGGSAPAGAGTVEPCRSSENVSPDETRIVAAAHGQVYTWQSLTLLVPDSAITENRTPPSFFQKSLFSEHRS